MSYNPYDIAKSQATSYLLMGFLVVLASIRQKKPYLILLLYFIKFYYLNFYSQNYFTMKQFKFRIIRIHATLAIQLQQHWDDLWRPKSYRYFIFSILQQNSDLMNDWCLSWLLSINKASCLLDFPTPFNNLWEARMSSPFLTIWIKKSVWPPLTTKITN